MIDRQIPCFIALCATAASAALMTTTHAARVPIGSGDFGSSTAQSLPDGTDDVLWFDNQTGELWVQFMNPSGLSVLRLRDVAGRSATPVLGQGAIASVIVHDGGDGYRVNGGDEQLNIDNTGSGGGGLAGTYNVTGSVVDINIVTGGSGYHDDGVGFFIVDDTGTGGSGLDYLFLTLPGDTDSVQRVVINDGGVGYEPGAELAVINANFLDSDAYENPMAGIAYVGDDGVIFQIDLVESGSGFIETPTVALLGATQGSGADLQAYMGGAIYDILPNPGNDTPGGSGYASDPIITPETNGTGFEYEIVREGGISGIQLTSAGFDYQVSPTIDGTVGVGANLEAVVFQSQDVWPAGAVPARTGTARVFGADGLPVVANTQGGQATDWNVGIGDFDADGDTDLALQPMGGAGAHIFLFEDGMVSTDMEVAAPEAGWRLAAAMDLDGVAGDELLWCDPWSQQSVVWYIDPNEPGFIGSGSGELVQPTLGKRYKVSGVLDSATGGSRLVWFNSREDLWATAKLTEGDATSVAELDWFASLGGDLWMPNDDSHIMATGDFDGDGIEDDLVIGRTDGRQEGMLQVWRTEDGAIVSDDIVTWQGKTMAAPLHRIGRLARNDELDSTIALRMRNQVVLYKMPSRGDAVSVPQDALAELLSPAANLAQLDGEDEAVIALAVEDFIDAAADIENASKYFSSKHVRSTLLAGLPIDLQVRVEEAMRDAFGDRTLTGTSTGTAISAAYVLAADGTTSVRRPGVLNRHYDYLLYPSDYTFGGPDGTGNSGGGTSSSGNSSSSGSSGESGGSGGSSGTGGSSGGSNGGLPDNFDPNDESTWPDGVDTFEQLIEYLANLEV